MNFKPDKLPELMAFILFAGDAFEIAHVGCRNGRTDDLQTLDHSRISSTLVVFDENLSK